MDLLKLLIEITRQEVFISATAAIILRENIEKILKIWEERAREEIQAASEQGSLALRNSLPEYLLKLADGLSGVLGAPKIIRPPDPSASIVSVSKHGRDRAESYNYTIDQLISEYHILRQTIFKVIEPEVELTSQERNIILDSIEQAVNDAATEFSNYLKAVQETLSNALVHDIRSPLAAVSLLVELIKSAPENEMHNEMIQKQILNSVKRIHSMLHHLLDYSSIQAGQGISMHFERFDMSKLVREIMNELYFSNTERFIVNIPRALMGTWDLRAVTSILENLATNALKYSETNTPIDVTVESHADKVLLIVHNIGKPIPPEVQEFLFQRFRRARNVQDKAGWGLGLTIVKSLAESHGGSVSMVSLEKTGTTFTVELPMVCSHGGRTFDLLRG